MVTNVTSLLKTVKAVEDEATRGTRALEATIECIKQELTVRERLPGRLLGRSLSAKLAQAGVFYSLQQQGSFLSCFSFFGGGYLATFFPSCFPLKSWRFFYRLLSVCESQVQAERGRKNNLGVSLF